MLNIWRQIRKLEGYNNCFSPLTPLHDNPDFPPGLRAGLADWGRKGIKVVGDMVRGGSVLTFQQVINKFGVSNGDFLRYLQVRNFILSKLKVFVGGLAISPVESLLVDNSRLKFLTKRLYGILCGFKEDNSDKVKGKWESDLGTIIKPEDWAALCNQPSNVLASNLAWERQCKIIHRLYIFSCGQTQNVSCHIRSLY